MEIMDYVPRDFGCILKFENDDLESSSSIEMEESGSNHAKYLQHEFPIHDTCTQNARGCVKRASLDSRIRRLRANDRERRRIQSINGAMEALRKAIPDTREKRKITKLQILRLAQRYIHTLTEILRTDSEMSPGTNDNSILEYRSDQNPCCN